MYYLPQNSAENITENNFRILIDYQYNNTHTESSVGVYEIPCRVWNKKYVGEPIVSLKNKFTRT